MKDVIKLKTKREFDIAEEAYAHGQTFENLPVYNTLTEKYESILGSTV